MAEKMDMTVASIYDTLEVHEIGKIVWLDDKVFVCGKCKRRYDFAIVYEGHERPSCRICSSDMTVTDASLRILGVIHPKNGGW